jgi:hypothetical protein
MQDMTKELKKLVAFNFQTIDADTTTGGNAIDLQGYEACDFTIVAGNLTDGVFTPLIEESDASGSGYTAVADDDLIGLEADAAVDADNEIKSIGYVGHKRYVKLSIVSSATDAGGPVGAIVTLGHARHNPVS